jgi:tRNA (mo5U34)-methyltransferase
MVKMTRDEILAGVERLKPWFHCIDLGQGIVTKTERAATEPVDHPRGTWEIIKNCLPQDLTGKRVLDVGCNAGFYSIEAKRRNAARVLGVDSQRHQVRQALFARRVLGLDIDFNRMSVYDLRLETVGTFDVVLALGLIYHLKHLILALERLFDVTGEMLILETAVLPPDKIPDLPFPCSVGGEGRPHHPMAYVENTVGDKEAVFNWFLPSPRATQALLRDVGFDEVVIVSVRGDRAVLVGRKPRAAGRGLASMQFASKLFVESGTRTTPIDGALRFSVRAENVGRATWPASIAETPRRGAVSLGAHLLLGEEDLDWDFGRVPLSTEVAPGAACTLTFDLQAPGEPGAYTVEFDLLAEQVSWFEDLGSEPQRHQLTVVPVAPHLPWYRLESLRAEVSLVDAPPQSSDAYLALVEAAGRTLADQGGAEAVLVGSRWMLGYRLDAVHVEEATREAVSSPNGWVRFVRRHLAAPEPRSVTVAPSRERVEALMARVGVSLDEQAEPAPSESFAGEAALGRRLLEAGAALPDREFVRFAYLKVLGRPADSGGEENASKKLASGEVSRAYFLRDLFWSDELRGMNSP